MEAAAEITEVKISFDEVVEYCRTRVPLGPGPVEIKVDEPNRCLVLESQAKGSSQQAVNQIPVIEPIF